MLIGEKMKVLFIYNSQSGKQIIDHKDTYLKHIEKSKHDFTIFDVKPNYGGYDFLMETDETFDVIIGVGGDGTISKIASAMIKRNLDSKLLIIPAGSTNEYSQTLGIDEYTFEEALSFIDEGTTKEVDVGTINDECFVYVSAFGNFTDVSYDTPQKWKNILGHFAYWIYGIFKINKIQNFRYKVSFNNQEHDEDYMFGLVSNAYQFGRVFKYSTDQVHLDDGHFEVLLVKKPQTIKDFIKLINSIILHDYDDETLFVKGKTNHITFESKECYTWNLDGEKGERTENIEIKVLPKKLKVLIK